MAVQNRQLIQSKAVEQSLQCCVDRSPRPSGWSQAADPHLQLVITHGKNPSIAVRYPLAAEHEAEPVPPSRRGSVISLKQPLASLPGEKRILWRINLNSGLAQQNTTRPGRIHQVRAHPLFTGFAVGLNPHHGTVCVKPQQSHASPRQQLHTGLHGLAP